MPSFCKDRNLEGDAGTPRDLFKYIVAIDSDGESTSDEAEENDDVDADDEEEEEDGDDNDDNNDDDDDDEAPYFIIQYLNDLVDSSHETSRE